MSKKPYKQRHSRHAGTSNRATARLLDGRPVFRRWRTLAHSERRWLVYDPSHSPMGHTNAHSRANPRTHNPNARTREGSRTRARAREQGVAHRAPPRPLPMKERRRGVLARARSTRPPTHEGGRTHARSDRVVARGAGAPADSSADGDELGFDDERLVEAAREPAAVLVVLGRRLWWAGTTDGAQFSLSFPPHFAVKHAFAHWAGRGKERENGA